MLLLVGNVKSHSNRISTILKGISDVLERQHLTISDFSVLNFILKSNTETGLNFDYEI